MVDGTSAPWFAADVGVRDGRIVAIGALAGHAATRTIDAKGLVVTPGFIDLLGQSEYNVLVDKRAASKITQGITTEVTGEGSSIAPAERPRCSPKARTSTSGTASRPTSRTLDGYFKTFERRGSADQPRRPSSAPAACATTSSARPTAARPRRS